MNKLSFLNSQGWLANPIDSKLFFFFKISVCLHTRATQCVRHAAFRLNAVNLVLASQEIKSAVCARLCPLRLTLCSRSCRKRQGWRVVILSLLWVKQLHNRPFPSFKNISSPHQLLFLHKYLRFFIPCAFYHCGPHLPWRKHYMVFWD